MSDPRFARVKSDPRFRRPRKKGTKVVIDERFTGIFTTKRKDKDQVDKYGRSLSSKHGRDNLERYYRLQNDSNGENSQTLPDYARGEVLLQSSDEDNQNLDSSEESDNNDIVTIGNQRSRPIVGRDQDEVNLDESDFADLDAQIVAYNKIHPIVLQEEGSRSRRLALVNLDWDHVRAGHIYDICSSLISPIVSAGLDLDPPRTSPDPLKKYTARHAKAKAVRGKVVSVRIYPSEFGKERMAREEMEGPPREIFEKNDDLSQGVNPQSIYDVRGEDDYNEDALRKYQLERLRYYYGIITCDTVDTASHIFQELDGTELERSANVFDLSFVPEDMIFGDEWRDEATAESNSSLKRIDFVTDALRHSKVKLTWDEDDAERNQVTRRRLSKKEIEEADFNAYLASDSGSEEEYLKYTESFQPNKNKGSSRDKLRALLLSRDTADLPEGWSRENNDTSIDMEITFVPGLSEKKDNEETTLDKYQRKIKDKRKSRKERLKEETSTSSIGDGFFEHKDQDGDTHPSLTTALTEVKWGRTKNLMQSMTRPEEMALPAALEVTNDQPKHFNLKSILKAENKLKRKTTKRHRAHQDDDHQEDFSINVHDDRFKALHEDHHYAIDPSNPQFKRTKAMSALLEERAQRQKQLSGQGLDDVLSSSSTSNSQKGLRSLVENVKRTSVNAVTSNAVKRQKVSL